MRKAAYWSLICFPLAAMMICAACVLAVCGSVWQAAGWSTMALYMLLVQAIWAYFADRTRPTAGDLGFTCFASIGMAFDLPLIFGHFGEITSTRLVLISITLVLLAQPFGRLCQFAASRAASRS